MTDEYVHHMRPSLLLLLSCLLRLARHMAEADDENGQEEKGKNVNKPSSPLHQAPSTWRLEVSLPHLEVIII